MHISNPGIGMAPAVLEFGAFYSASILAVTANPIYELASLCRPHGQIGYDGIVPVSSDVPIYCNVPVQQTNHLLADRQHSPSGRLQAINVKHAYCNMQKVSDVIKSDVTNY